MNRIEFNWLTPTISRRGGYAPPDMLQVIYQKKEDKTRSLIFFSSGVCEKYLRPGEENTIAFAFDDNQLFITFNPPTTVFSYPIRANKSVTSITNKELIEEIYSHFKLNTGIEKYYLKIHHWGTHEGMEIYSLSPHEYDTLEPIFFDE